MEPMSLGNKCSVVNGNSFEAEWRRQQNVLLILDPNFEYWDDAAKHPSLGSVESGFIVTFSRAPHTFKVFNLLSQSLEFRDHIVWHDPQPQWVSNELALRVTEDILVFRVGKPKCNMKSGDTRKDAGIAKNKGKPSIGRWSDQSQRTYTPSERSHLTTLISQPRNLNAALGRWQKPDRIAETIVRAYSADDWTVYDPFCGSGSFLWAADCLGRKSFGVELDRNHFDACVTRFSQQSFGSKLLG